MARARSLAALGALEVAALAAMGWIPGGRATPLPAFLLWGAAWLALVAAVARVRGTPLSLPAASPGRRGIAARTPDGVDRAVMWCVAVLGRAALWPLSPHFSDDVWRYLWDGWTALQGINPYVHAPDAAALEPFRTSWHHLINHPGVSTIYPPGAQVVFLLLAALGPGVLLFKAAWILADLGVGWVLERLEARRGGRGTAPLLWLWSPLVLVEVAWSGHMDPLGVLPMMAALLALAGTPAGGPGPPAPGEGPEGGRGRCLLGGALLGLGASVKFAPALAIPALWRRRGATAAAVAVAVPLLLVLPYVGAGPDLWAGLGEYATRWRFNAGLFLPLEALLGTPAARVAATVLPGAVAAGAAWRRWRLDRTLLWAIGTGVALAPTIHPWYLLWILPLAALRRSVPWIVFTATVFLAYAGHDVYRATGEWPESPWVRVLVHGPFLLALAAELARHLRNRAEGNTDAPEEFPG